MRCLHRGDSDLGKLTPANHASMAETLLSSNILKVIPDVPVASGIRRAKLSHSGTVSLIDAPAEIGIVVSTSGAVSNHSGSIACRQRESGFLGAVRD